VSGATIAEAAVAGETTYRVRVGSYPDRARAAAAARALTTRGYRALVIEQ
jgi:cell division protein FtsN